MRFRLREAALLIAACTGAAAGAPDSDEANTSGPFGRAIAHARARVVKVYGASIGREAGYGSGIVISADGDILTTASVLLEGRSLRVPDSGHASSWSSSTAPTAWAMRTGGMRR